MTNRGVLNKRTIPARLTREPAGGAIHPACHAFIRYCAELKHREIGTLKIQDGLPVLAEVVRKKVQFGSQTR